MFMGDILTQTAAAEEGAVAATIPSHTKNSGEQVMSAPSRRPEIRRRRTRAEKIAKLQKRHAKASNDSDRTRLAGKLHRLSLKSPGQTLIKNS